MLRSACVLLVLSVFTGAANAQNAIQLYKAALYSCANKTLPGYDDGVTSAAVVAHVLVGVCRRQTEPQYLAAMGDRSAAYRRGFNGAAEEAFTGLVLQHRAAKFSR
ncbi:MAG TPA: hypothetical protein VIJ79_12995 [Acidobacteriaceae bacterium]